VKQLFDKQLEAKDFFRGKHLAGVSTLDTSSTGTGKTVVAARLAMEWVGRNYHHVAVLCPKAVIPSWERELKECNVTPLFVTNYEKIRGGKTSWMTKQGSKIMSWKLPQNTLVFLDEVHKCKGPYTQNAQLFISLVQQGYVTHSMSATAAENPSEMRGLGFAMKLHNLNKTENKLPNFFSWMMKNGCVRNSWGQWEFVAKRHLTNIRAELYEVDNHAAHKLSIADFPDSFRANMVHYEPIQFSNLSKIRKAFEDLGLTPQIMEDYIENGTVEDKNNIMLVNILRARQLAESLKIHDIAEMAEDLLIEGKSVVIFVNFSDTADALAQLLECGKIVGNQTASERQNVIDRFQRDDDRVVVVNIAAGGTGISLHDLRGEYPRVSLISPCYSAKNHVQCLGRIHRNGAKSDTIQKVLFAADSIEETVIKALQRKVENLTTLHGGA